MARPMQISLVLLLLGGGAALGWLVPKLYDLPVRNIVISGDLTEHEREAVRLAISAAITIENGSAAGLHSLPLPKVQNAVAELTWAEAVGVRRRWPGTLEVQLRRRGVAARWGGGGYVAGNGHVIEPVGEVPGDLPLLDCQQSSAPRGMEVFQLLSARLAPAGLRPRVLRESLLGEWTVELENGVQVVLGRAQLRERLERFLAVYDALPQQAARLGTVDARYHNGVAVAWRDAVSAAIAQRME